MNQEQYWRNLIADEIHAEMTRVESYYMKKGMNSGGMSNEEHTRLNIFRLCESISRSIKQSPDAPKQEFTPVYSSNTVEEIPINEDIELSGEVIEIPPDSNQMTIEQIVQPLPPVTKPSPDLIQNLIKDTPRQNQFGEFI